MRRIFCALLVGLAMLFAAPLMGAQHTQTVDLSSFSMPNPAATPGDTLVSFDKAYLCGHQVKQLNVTFKTLREVLEKYPVPKEEMSNYQLDRLIPSLLGGADTPLNVWLQPYFNGRDGKFGAKQKDVLENVLYVQMCAGKIGLETAQKAIVKNWKQAYVQYVLHLPVT